MSAMIPDPWLPTLPCNADLADDSDVNLQSCAFLCAGLFGALVLLRGANAVARNGALAAVAACATLMFSTTGQTIMDKGLSSSLHTPGIITLVEMAVCTGVLSFTSSDKLRETPKDQVMTWLIVPVFYAANVVFTLVSLQYVPIAVFTISRTLAPFLAILFDKAVLPVDKQQPVNFTMMGGLTAAVAGAVIYGQHIYISAAGLICTGASLVAHVLSRVIERRLLAVECKDMPTDMCSLICNSVGMLPVLAFVYATGEFAKVSENSETFSTWSVLFLLAIFGITGVANTNARYECQRTHSTASVIVMQNTSRFVAVVLGMVVFDDPSTLMAWLGIGLNTIGSAMYWWSQSKAGLRAPVKDETTPLSTE